MKVFLAILLLVGTSSAWADTYTWDGLTYEYTPGTTTCSITDCETTVSGSLTIPSNVVIAGIGYEVTSIGEYAFQNCSALTYIYIIEGITSIEKYAFQNCTSLNYISIPGSVTSIGNFAFQNCTSLATINISEGLTSIGGSAFVDCSSLTTFNIPEGVTSIGNWAFRHCTSLSHIRIPKSVAKIGAWAFDGCTGLIVFKGTTPPANCLDGAFSEFLGKVIVPLGCSETYLDQSTAFSNVADIVLEMATPEDLPLEFEYNDADGTCSVSDCISSTKSVDIPKELAHEGKIYTVTGIGKYAFYLCTSLSSVNIPEGIETIGSEAFRECGKLTALHIPESVKSIGGGAFWECSSLSTVNIPGGVETIGDWMFYACSALKSIIIPESITSIESYVFSGCTCSILFQASTPPAINAEHTFSNFSGEIIVPFGSGEAYRTACPAVADKIIEMHYAADIPLLTFTYNVEDKTCSVADCEQSATSVDIPTELIYEGNVYTVTNIGKEAFYGCASLSAVNIPESVTRIENYAFYGCSSLSAINIHGGVEYIGHQAFRHCSSLSSVTLSEGVDSIQYYTFADCSSLSSIYIPGSVTDFGDYIFYNCKKLEKIFVPYDCVESIKSKLSRYAEMVVGTVDVDLKAASIGGAYASAYFPFAVTLDEGDAEVYVGESLDGNMLTMTETTEVAANNGFILSADAATTVTLKIGATEAAATSVLSGTTAEIILDDTNRNDYLLFGVKRVAESATATLGFFKPAASVTSIAANRAFLPNTSSVAFARMKFDFSATGIEVLENEEWTMDNGQCRHLRPLWPQTERHSHERQYLYPRRQEVCCPVITNS